MFINSCIALFIDGVYLAFINTPDIEHVIPEYYTDDKLGRGAQQISRLGN